MRSIQAQAALADQHGLFRAASALDVTSSLLNCSRCLPVNSLRKVAKADIFVSHSWSCASWMKALALCHHLNLDLAIASSVVIAALSATFILFLLQAGDAAQRFIPQPEDVLFVWLFYVPMATFLIVYLFGHVFSKTCIWFDQVCVEQDQPSVKAQTLQAVPAFVAQSAQMLVLWDETYCQRLWCNYELAVRAKAGPEHAMVLVPMWKPLWTLSWFGIGFVLSCMVMGYKTPPFETASRRALFMSLFELESLPLYMYVCSGVPFSWFCLEKLRRHRWMLDEMQRFDLKNARCTLESDRQIIEEHISDLFDEALDPPLSVALDAEESRPPPLMDEMSLWHPWRSIQQPSEDEMQDAAVPLVQTMRDIRHITSYPTRAEVIGEFNAYVRATLRDSVVTAMGQENEMPFKLCMVAILPFMFLSFVTVLGCDGHRDCRVAASNMGFTSVSAYMVSDAVMNFLLVPLFLATNVPLALRCNQLVTRCAAERGILQLLLGSVLTGTALWISDCFMMATGGIFFVVIEKYSPIWLAGFMACVILQLAAVCLLFCKITLPRPKLACCRSIVVAPGSA